MQRINTAYFYKLAQKLLPLRNLSAGTKLYFENYMLLYSAQEELQFFLHNPLLPPMTSYGTGSTLLALVEKITGETYEESRELQWGESPPILEALNHFEIALQSDFATRDTFIVSPKAAYSTTLLAERGETAVSESARELVPSLSEDMASGSRCLAFELPTGAAFHFFRAVEAMVRAYGEYVRNKPFTDREKKNGLGGYSNFLKETSLAVDIRITNYIDQLSSLHRNPTMHPEMTISKTEIMATLGMVVSVIEVVAVDWNRRKITPNVPLIDILPDDTKVVALLEENDENKSEVKMARSRRKLPLQV